MSLELPSASAQSLGDEEGARQKVLARRTPAPLTGEAVLDETDGGAIEIEDEYPEDHLGGGLEDTGILVGTDAVIVGGEEAPPFLTAPYAEAFFNTDPRVSFDVLHIGVLRAIESREGISRTSFEYPTYAGPSVELVTRPLAGGEPFFTVPSMHPGIRSRSPLGRDCQKVESILDAPTRETLMAAIGPDLLEKLRMHRRYVVRRRRKRLPTS